MSRSDGDHQAGNSSQPVDLGFLQGGGEMGERMRAHDWTTSPLGDPNGWPQSLRAVIALMINSKYPMFVAWGPELAFLYNDGYIPIFGDKHPHTLGLPFKQVWPEIWDDIWPLIERALSGEATFNEDLHLVMERHGYPEDTWYSFSYSPVRDESGAVAGMFCACTETTRQVVGEAALRKSEERLQFALAAASGVGSWDWDLANDLVYSDAAFANLYGVEPDLAAAGRPIAEFTARIHPEDAQRVEQEIAQAIATGDSFVAEYRLIASDETITWVSARGRCHRDAEGRRIRFPGVTFDITDRKRAEALHETKNHILELAIQDRPLGETLEELIRIIERHSNGDVLGSILLLDAEGQHLLHGAAPSLPEAYNAAIHGLKIGSGVGSCGTAAQEKRPVYASDIDTDPNWKDFRELAGEHGLKACWSTPIVTGAGILLGTFAMYYRESREPSPDDLALVADITRSASLIIERHRAQDALRDSEERYRTLFNSIDEGFCVIEFVDGPHGPLSDYIHVEANPAYAVHTGIPNVVGQYVRQMVGDEAAGWIDLYRNVLVSGEPIRFERDLEATGRVLELFAARLEPETRRQVMVLFRDVSERVAAERALRGLNETLELRVSEEVDRRSEAEEALRQSQKMETLGQLTGGIAHDFNNLLQIITGNLDIISRGLPGDSARLKRAADNAAKGADRAAILTQRLLAFARRQPLEPKVIDANKLIAGMSEMLHRALGETVGIETVMAPGLWRAEADPNQLETALLNLAVNSRDAMPGGGKLTIETGNTYLDRDYTSKHSGVAEGQYVAICVSDTGSGMDEETAERAFDPFFTTKEVGKGTGLGLSMVYGFVKQSNGHLNIYTEPGQGTTIKIYLPRHRGAVDVADDSIAAPLSPEGSDGETILVCEDDADVRAYSVDTLRELGYRVIEAADGDSALRLLSGEKQVDLLFTDIVLPGGMTGAVVADEARKLRPGLKVLFTTGYARNAIVHHGRLDPGVQLLSKPFSYSDLAARIRDLLDGV